MTTYGTIPTETPEFSNRPFGTRVTQLIESGFGTPRQWNEVIQIQSFNLPTAFGSLIERIQTNTAIYCVNYAIIVLSIVFISLFCNPVSLVFLMILIAAWLFLYFFRVGDSLIVHGLVIDDGTLMIVLLIIIGLPIGTLVIVAHARLRSTDDMFSVDDDARLGSLQGKHVAHLPLKPGASSSFSSP